MLKKFLYISFIILSIYACKVSYSFSGINISKDVKTYQVDYIPNNASIIVPGLNEDFRNMLIDKINRMTNLEQVKEKGDLIFQGEIADYYIQPVAQTAQQTAAQNRLTIKIKIDYTNNKNEEDNYTKTYSWYKDYPANVSQSDIEAEANEEILKKILDDIFNDTLAKW